MTGTTGEGVTVSNSRRAVIVVLDEACVVNACLGLLGQDAAPATRATNLPPGVKCERAFHTPDRMGVCAILTHDTFDEVPPGCMPPVRELEWGPAAEVRRGREFI